jgi:hypothetical protein
LTAAKSYLSGKNTRSRGVKAKGGIIPHPLSKLKPAAPFMVGITTGFQ